MIGSLVFILTLVADNIQDYRDAKKLSRGLTIYKRRGIAHTLGGLFFFVGLGGFILFPVAGAIIFVGIVVSYFVSGVVGQEVGGIPLRMGYGGWYVARRRGRPRRGGEFDL